LVSCFATSAATVYPAGASSSPVPQTAQVPFAGPSLGDTSTIPALVWLGSVLPGHLASGGFAGVPVPISTPLTLLRSTAENAANSHGKAIQILMMVSL
jgi:hypothetical protein